MKHSAKQSMRQWMERHDVTPAKLGLVVTLSVVLIVVLAIQLPRIFGGPEVSVETMPPESPVVSVTPTALVTDNGTEGTSRTVPMVPVDGESRTVIAELIAERRIEIPVERITQIDPFAPIVATYFENAPMADSSDSRGMTTAGAETSSPSSNAMQLPLTVDQIVIGPNGAATRIGGAWYNVGDVRDGYRIQEIRRDGVVLSAE